MTQRNCNGIRYNTGARLCYSFYREIGKLVTEMGLQPDVKKQPGLDIYCQSGQGRYPVFLGPDRRILWSPVLPRREKLRLVRLLPDLLHARRHIHPGSMVTAARFDGTTLAEYIRQKVGTEFLRLYVEPVFQATRSWDASEVSSAFFVGTSAHMLFGGHTYTFAGGIGQLCQTLAAKLDVRYEAHVKRVVRNRNSRDCTVDFDVRGTRHELKSDIVVCAVEGSRVLGMLADPWPEEAAFFSHVRYNALGVVHLLTPGQKRNGVTFFPRASPDGLSILEISDYQADGARGSKLYCQLTPEMVQRAQREAKTDELFELVEPAISRLCSPLTADRAHIVNQWIEHMLPVFYPGYIGHLRSFLQRQESAPQRVYYCGDYLAQALVEGACYSGARVAERIAAHWPARRGG